MRSAATPRVAQGRDAEAHHDLRPADHRDDRFGSKRSARRSASARRRPCRASRAVPRRRSRRHSTSRAAPAGQLATVKEIVGRAAAVQQRHLRAKIGARALERPDRRSQRCEADRRRRRPERHGPRLRARATPSQTARARRAPPPARRHRSPALTAPTARTVWTSVPPSAPETEIGISPTPKA